MAIKTVKMLNLRFPRNDLVDVLGKIKKLSNIKLIESSKIVNDVKDVTKMITVNDYKEMLDHLHNIGHDLKLEYTEDMAFGTSLDLKEENKYLENLDKKIDEIERIKNDLLHDKKENEQVVQFLEKFTSKNINVEELMDLSYVSVKFGYLDNNQMDNLKYYLEKPFIFDTMMKEAKITWCYYVVTNSMKPEVDNLFKALDFHEVEIPHIVHGDNADALKELQEEAKTMGAFLNHVEEKREQLKQAEANHLIRLYGTARYLNELEQLKKYVVDYTSVLSISGFVDEDDIVHVQNKFIDIPTVQFSILPTSVIGDDEDIPDLYHNPAYIQPFARISKPTHHEKRDLTVLYFIVYMLTFMLGFGDILFGALSFIYGIIAKRRLVLELGFASLIGGLIYGTYLFEFNLYQAISFDPLRRIEIGIAVLFVFTVIMKIVRKK